MNWLLLLPSTILVSNSCRLFIFAGVQTIFLLTVLKLLIHVDADDSSFPPTETPVALFAFRRGPAVNN